jgi:quercetin dioxygenase-like cupin family protein
VRHLDPIGTARAAVSARGDRPAMSILHDSADARLITFRLAPGQTVPPHRSSSTVILTVLSGTGVLSGDPAATPSERRCTVGDIVAYEPNELHGMRADTDELIVLATITPRPGER